MVECPNEGFETVYDEWLNVSHKVYNGVNKPYVGNLGSGSDYTAFLQLYGVSAADMRYVSMSVCRHPVCLSVSMCLYMCKQEQFIEKVENKYITVDPQFFIVI